MKRLTENSPFLVFYVFAVALYAGGVALVPMAPTEGGILLAFWAWLEAQQLSINLHSITRFGIEEEPGMLMTYIRAGAPTIAALFVCWQIGGGRMAFNLLRRLRPWLTREDRGRALRAYAILFGLYFTGVIAYLMLGTLLGPVDKADTVLERIGGFTPFAFVFLTLSLFLDEGGTLEELGWRGFALPLLMIRFSPLKASIIIGLLWWAWHLPREIPRFANSWDDLSFWLSFSSVQAQFILLCLSLSVICTWFVNMTGGSALPAIMIHGGTNVWSKALSDPIWASLGVDLRIWIVVSGAVVLFIAVGPRLGLKPGQKITSPIETWSVSK